MTPAAPESVATQLRAVHQRMKAVASAARLPLNAGRWSGVSGNILGQGTGSSIDFHDQRPYHPGDDPRHINWQAYARTGQYTMKLYRQEVTPKVDLIYDASASMSLTTAKQTRSWELLYFCIESALRHGSALTLQVLESGKLKNVPIERLLAYDAKAFTQEQGDTSAKLAPILSNAPFRAGSLRVFISDLLYEEAPAGLIAPLIRERGRCVVFAPFCQEESQPDWQGNLEFESCETGLKDQRRVEKDVLARYLQAYERHFSLWQEESSRRSVAFARVFANGDFFKALRVGALPAGAIEMTA